MDTFKNNQKEQSQDYLSVLLVRKIERKEIKFNQSIGQELLQWPK